jgi:hypothetical protein
LVLFILDPLARRKPSPGRIVPVCFAAFITGPSIDPQAKKSGA